MTAAPAGSPGTPLLMSVQGKPGIMILSIGKYLRCKWDPIPDRTVVPPAMHVQEPGSLGLGSDH